MDFGFGEDQELLRSTTRRFLTEHQSLADVRRSMEEPDLFDPDVWRQGAELGWTAMLVPSEHEGGSVTDQPLVDLVVLAEELGRELNPGPFVPSNVVADAVARFGTEVQGKEHLPRIAPRRGDVRLVPERGRVARACRRRGLGRRGPATAGGSTAWPATSTPRATPPCSSSRRRRRRATAPSTCWCRAPRRACPIGRSPAST